MNSNEKIPTPEESVETIVADDTESVDDFIRELEAKEKDLHITADLKIEVSDSEFDSDGVPDFAMQDLSPAAAAKNGPASVAAPATKVRNFELENEVAALKVRVMQLKAERNEIHEKSDRRVKDFESYRYRMDRERRSVFIDQIANLAQQMLPVLDNLNRALYGADESGEERSAEHQQFYDGIVLVHQQVNDVFAGMGVQPIATVGEAFDPNFHEAVATCERPDMPPNTVCEEILRGYRIGNKVIRHSMVMVTLSPSPAERLLTPTNPPETDAPTSVAD